MLLLCCVCYRERQGLQLRDGRAFLHPQENVQLRREVANCRLELANAVAMLSRLANAAVSNMPGC